MNGAWNDVVSLPRSDQLVYFARYHHDKEYISDDNSFPYLIVQYPLMVDFTLWEII